MKRVIKGLESFKKHQMEEIIQLYIDGELERSVFPYKGDFTEGVLFKEDEVIYLIPIDSIKKGLLAIEDIDKEDDLDFDFESDLDDNEG